MKKHIDSAETEQVNRSLASSGHVGSLLHCAKSSVCDWALLAVSRSACGQLPQCGEESGSGARIVERVEGDGGGELWRFRAEANL